MFFKIELNLYRLGYFEIKDSAYSWKELTNEAILHYQNQVYIKIIKILIKKLNTNNYCR